MNYRILVTGSRAWHDPVSVRLVLTGAFTEAFKASPKPQHVVITHGAAKRGADLHAARWVQEHLRLGWPVVQEAHPADWSTGRGAGFARNAEMVALGADTCLAFLVRCTDRRCLRPRPHDSHGAAHCAQLAERAGIPTTRLRGEDR